MTVFDIHSFVTNFSCGATEHLYLWLTQYKIENQLHFIDLLTGRKIRRLNAKRVVGGRKHPTDGCCCLRYYDRLDDWFKEIVPLDVIGACVADETLAQAAPLQRIDTRHKYRATRNASIALVYRRTIGLAPGLMFFDSESWCGGGGKNRESPSVSAVYENRSTMHKLLDKLTVCELYTLYTMHTTVTRHTLERLLPEYWRSYDRSVLEKNRLTGKDLLVSVYDFHTISAVLQTDTTAKAAFKLPPTVDADVAAIHEYVVQPNLNGFRVVISKYRADSPNVFVTNAHGVKCPFPRATFDAILSEAPSFCGEFLLMPYDGGEYMHAKSYYATDSVALRLVLVDLFVWSSVNLLNLAYAYRFDTVMPLFTQTVPGVTLVASLNASQMVDAMRNYESELLQTTPHFNGFVYRRRQLNYQRAIAKYKFRVARFDVFRRAATEQLLVREGETRRVTDGFVIPRGGHRYTANFVAYESGADTVALAAYHNDTGRFVRLQSLCVDFKLALALRGSLYVENRLWPWTVVKIDFNEISATAGDSVTIRGIGDIVPRPDKSLLDCTPLHVLRERAIAAEPFDTRRLTR